MEQQQPPSMPMPIRMDPPPEVLHKSKFVPSLITFIVLCCIVIPLSLFVWKQSAVAPKQVQHIVKSSPQLQTVAPMNDWKSYVNHSFGFGFSYPPDLTLQDLGGANHIDVELTDASSAPVVTLTDIDSGSLCSGGGSILPGDPQPTEPIKIAEAASMCECLAGSSQNGSLCSFAKNELVVLASASGMQNVFQYSLQQDTYKSSTLSATHTRGPFTAFFFPQPVSVTLLGVTKHILGFYFESVVGDALPSYQQIIDSVHLTPVTSVSPSPTPPSSAAGPGMQPLGQ